MAIRPDGHTFKFEITNTHRSQQISSPVIVDFKSAYQHESKWKPGLKEDHVIPWLYDQKGILEVSKRNCSHKNCHKTGCIKDVAIAQQKMCLEKGFRDIGIILDSHIVETKEQLQSVKEDLRSRNLLQLLPGTAYAFALRNRKWGRSFCLSVHSRPFPESWNAHNLLIVFSHDLVEVDLSNLETVKQEDNWDDLILPAGHKEMVQAMVMTHTRAASSLAIEGTRGQGEYEVDLVPGKGETPSPTSSHICLKCTKQYANRQRMHNFAAWRGSSSSRDLPCPFHFVFVETGADVETARSRQNIDSR